MSSKTTKACLAVGVLTVGWYGYKWITARPIDKFVQAIVDAGDDVELAEECLMNVTLNNDTLTALTPLEHEFQAQELYDEAVVKAQDEAEHAQAVRIAAATDAANMEEQCYVVPGRVRVKRDKLANSNPTVEVRASRIVIGKYRATYARRVLDACKSKFGCPDVSKANHRAVWRFAEQVMKDHGLRPSHRAELLPYVVQLTFVPSVADTLAMDAGRSYEYFTQGGLEKQLSKVELWTRKCSQLFWRE